MFGSNEVHSVRTYIVILYATECQIPDTEYVVQGQIRRTTIVIKNFSILFTVIDRSRRQKN